MKKKYFLLIMLLVLIISGDNRSLNNSLNEDLLIAGKYKDAYHQYLAVGDVSCKSNSSEFIPDDDNKLYSTIEGSVDIPFAFSGLEEHINDIKIEVKNEAGNEVLFDEGDIRIQHKEKVNDYYFMNLYLYIRPGFVDGIYSVIFTYNDIQVIRKFEVFMFNSVEGIESNDAITIGKGYSRKIDYKITPDNATNKNVLWESSNTNFVDVDDSGNIFAKDIGEATITIKSADGGEITKEVTVNVVDEYLELLAPKLNYKKNGDETIEMEAIVENISIDSLEAKLYKENVINHTSECNVVETSKGFANISCLIPDAVGSYEIKVTTSGDGELKKVPVTVNEPGDVTEMVLKRNSIELSDGEEFELLVGETDILEVSLNAGASNKNVIWESSNSEIVEVDNNGNIIAKGIGEAFIIVSSEYDPDFNTSCKIVVKGPEITIGDLVIDTAYNEILYSGYGGYVVVPIDTKNIKNLSMLDLKFYKVTNEREEELLSDDIVSQSFEVYENLVSDNKVNLWIKVLNSADAGNYQVKVGFENAETQEFDFEVAVPKPVEEIVAEGVDDTIRIEKGKSQELKITVLPEDAFNKDFTISTEDTDTMKIEGNIIIGIEPGKATLTIKSKDGKAEKVINVEVFERKITLEKSDVIYNNQVENIKMSATLHDIDADKVSVLVYKNDSLNTVFNSEYDVIENIADIEFLLDSDIELGEYTVSVGANGIEVSEKFEIKEYIPLTNIEIMMDSVRCDSIELLVGNEENLIANITPENATDNIVWESSNPDNVQIIVDENQNNQVSIIAKKRGDSIIKAKSKDTEIETFCDVFVISPGIEIGKIEYGSTFEGIMFPNGGTIKIPITTQDIKVGEALDITFYKDGIEVDNQNNDYFEVKGNSVGLSAEETTKLELEIVVKNSVDLGEYTVKVDYTDAETKEFKFEVVNSIIYVSDISSELYETIDKSLTYSFTMHNLQSTVFNYQILKIENDVQEPVLSGEFSLEEDAIQYQVRTISIEDLTAGDYILKICNGDTCGETTFKIKEYVPVEDIKFLYNDVSIEKIVMLVGTKVKVDTVVTNQDATFKEVTYSNSDDAVAKRFDDGTIESFTTGTIELKATVGGKEVTLPITVIDIPKVSYGALKTNSNLSGNSFIDNKYGGNFTINAIFDDINVDKGISLESISLKDSNDNKNVLFKFSSERILGKEYRFQVGVDGNKNIPAGTYVVNYKYYINDTLGSEMTSSFEITIKDYVKLSKINVSNSNIKLYVDESINIDDIVGLFPSNATNKNVTYSVSNSNVLKLNGKSIKALSNGISTVTITSKEDASIKSVINVTVKTRGSINFGNNINILNADNSKYLKGLTSGSTYRNLLSNIETEENIFLRESNGNMVTSTSSILKTGMKLIVGNNTYNVVIKGDMSGDGKITITDLSQMRYHLANVSGKVKTGAYKQAGDMNDKDGVTITDLSQMRKKLAGVN